MTTPKFLNQEQTAIAKALLENEFVFSGSKEINDKLPETKTAIADTIKAINKALFQATQAQGQLSLLL